jgi:hypothetical protein
MLRTVVNLDDCNFKDDSLLTELSQIGFPVDIRAGFRQPQITKPLFPEHRLYIDMQKRV